MICTETNGPFWDCTDLAEVTLVYQPPADAMPSFNGVRLAQPAPTYSPVCRRHAEDACRRFPRHYAILEVTD